jgi:hypothetical protein
MIQRNKPIAIFVAVLAFLTLTLPANHSEAEDAYAYASLTEQGNWPEMFHAHHLFYLPVTRSLFRAAQLAGYSGRALPVLIGFSMVCGSLAVLLFAAVLRRVGVQRGICAGFTSSLLFSYGFWRYSTTAEIYVPVCALSLVSFFCALRGTERPLFFYAGVLAAAAALLLHLAALPVALAAIPLLYFLRRRTGLAARHIVLVLLAVSAGYALVIAGGMVPGTSTDALVLRTAPTEPVTWLKALAAFGQTLLSGNFLFSFPAAADRLQALFPFHMLQEEVFAGRQAPAWIRIAAPATFGLALAAGAALFGRLLNNSKSNTQTVRSPAGAAALIWLAGAAGMAFLFEPANPEMWICVLPPFWLMLAFFWKACPDGRIAGRIPAVLAVAVLLHNRIGGMETVKRPQGDYCRQKAAFILNCAEPDDLIVSADSYAFITFLAYETSAQVLDAKFISAEDFLMTAGNSTGRIFIFDDVINPLPPVARRPPKSVRQLQQLSQTLLPELTPVHGSLFGTLYQWNSHE